MKRRVVIVGGGFAGAYAAQHLENDFDVTMIDTKDYFEFTPGILRTIVEPQHVKKVQVLHTHFLKRATVIRGTVTSMDKKFVYAGKKKYPYDYAVLSAGSRYNSPFKESKIVLSTRADILRHCYEDLCKAKRVLIIGGGPVGVELAAEIATHYDGKEINLVQGADKILNRSPARSIAYAEKFLGKRGVNIITGEKIKETKGKVFHTDQGRTIKSDMTFLCVGIRANSGWVRDCYPNCVDERDAVKVNKYLQLGPHKNIFVAGDMNNLREEKLAQAAEKQAHHVVKNIRALEEKDELSEYQPMAKPMIISLGKWHGIFQYKSFVVNGLIAGLLKTVVEWKTMLRYR